MLEIPLTRGKFAFIDNEDLEVVMRYKWQYVKVKTGEYASTSMKIGKEQITLRMHRLIMGENLDQYIDHKNGNGLDNRRENLRFCTPKQNSANARKRKPMTSIFKGVSYSKRTDSWRATIMENGKCLHLGYFKNETLAAIRYNEKAKLVFGDFVHLNEIPSPNKVTLRISWE